MGAMPALFTRIWTGPSMASARSAKAAMLLSLATSTCRLCARTPSLAASTAVSAAVSPFLVSVTGIGYEQRAYVWTGFGVWTQLWASVTLPLAWGFGWRAISTGRGVLWAAPVSINPLDVAGFVAGGGAAYAVTMLREAIGQEVVRFAAEYRRRYGAELPHLAAGAQLEIGKISF